jgi:hypothetical protein
MGRQAKTTRKLKRLKLLDQPMLCDWNGCGHDPWPCRARAWFSFDIESEMGTRTRRACDKHLPKSLRLEAAMLVALQGRNMEHER